MKLLKLAFSFFFFLSLSSCSSFNVSDTSGTFPQDSDEPSDSLSEEEENNMIFIYINNVKIGIELESNSSVDALVDILKETNITYSAHDYGGFEKVGDIGYTLPQNNTSITTEPGDVILYQGTSICLYYDTNTWSFTKIGHIYHYSQEQLKELLKADQGDIEITLSLV